MMLDERQQLYRDGYNDYFVGISEDDSGYTKYSSLWSYWHDGYIDARDADIRSQPSGIGAAFENYER